MNVNSWMKWLGYGMSLVVLIIGFLLFYSDTQEWISSLMAALLSAALILGSFIALRWLVQVFTK